MLEKFLIFASIVILATISIGPVNATDVFYGNIHAKSPNGRFEAKAISPANKDGHRKAAFQKDFTITFTDAKSGEEIWSWKQKEDKSSGLTRGAISPIHLIPADDGYLIMLDACFSYYVFDKNGVKTEVFCVLREIPKREKKKFVDWTSAGPRWSQYAQEGIFAFRGKLYFYIRLYWGRTFVIDIAKAQLHTDGELVDEAGKRILK